MSRLIKVALGVGVCIGMAGCEVFLAASPSIPVATQVAVADGSVVVAGPRGFCVDPRSTSPSTDVPFVMMGNCAAISGDGRAPQPGIEAVLTATVAPLDPSFTFDSNDPALPVFFESDAGRAALSRAGDPQSVEVIDSFARGPVFYLHARDTSPGPVANIDETHWRAVFGVNGRVVSASVLDFRDSALSPELSLNLLTQFAKRIRAQSVGRGPEVVDAAPSAPVSVPAAAPEVLTLGPALRPLPRPGRGALLPAARPVERPAPPTVRAAVFPPIGFLRRLFAGLLWTA